MTRIDYDQMLLTSFLADAITLFAALPRFLCLHLIMSVCTYTLLCLDTLLNH